jgi:hypothetical protein
MEKAEKFNEWMRNVVKSYYYSDNEKMMEAFNSMINKDGRNYKQPDTLKSVS